PAMLPASDKTARLLLSTCAAIGCARLALVRLAGIALAGLAHLAEPAEAFEGRLLRSDGSPAAGYEVTVAGRALAARTDGEGRFRIVPDPAVPFTLVATGPGEELSAPVEVGALPAPGA